MWYRNKGQILYVLKKLILPVAGQWLARIFEYRTPIYNYLLNHDYNVIIILFIYFIGIYKRQMADL